MGIEAIAATSSEIGTRIVGAIQQAAQATGAGFDYLLKTAMRESNLNPNVTAKSSSATGLFQFIDQTWLATMKESGPGLGYGKYADAITKTASGRYIVADPTMRRDILALRKDPTANSVMAGALTQSNARLLAAKIGRAPSDGELYIAHFLGASGAGRFITAAQSTPNAKAANLFPRAARANPSIFYDKQGHARSVSKVYDALVSKHQMTRTPAVAPVPPLPVPAAPPIVTASNGTLVPAVVPVTNISAASTPVTLNNSNAATTVVTANNDSGALPVTTAYAPDATQAPVFHGLFQTEPRGAVAPVVSALWGAKPAAPTELASAVTPAQAPSAPAVAPGRINAPLDLFQFLRPSVRGAA